jgi:hypothetical protein
MIILQRIIDVKIHIFTSILFILKTFLVINNAVIVRINIFST